MPRLSFLSPYWLWLVLSLPALGMISELMTSENVKIVKMMLHPSGETSARLLIITMMATPLAMLLKGWRGPIWLKKNRRYFGVAAFAYAALHTVLYVVDVATLERVLKELPRLHIWTGWAAFAIFIPLAATSMDYFVRFMGPRWKLLQRTTYVAAVLTLVHWASTEKWEHPLPAIIHFAPLVLLEAYRIWYWYLRPHKKAVAV